MLTTQESLEAMAGRSPDGKPLVFVSQQDYDALRKQYEELLKTAKQRRLSSRWQAALVVATVTSIVVAISTVAARPPSASAQIEPFGKYFYAYNDLVGVRAANAFCTSRSQKRQMHPVNVFCASGLVFECVKRADEMVADERAAAKRDAEPWQFTPSPENRARCVELRDQRKRVADNVNEAGLLSAAERAEKLDGEADALKCWSKP